MITNKDVRVENGNLVLNGDKYPLDGQSPEAIMEIVEENSDSTPTENSTAPITSGGVYTALGTKQDTLTFDTVPTENSTNPVESGGVKTYVDQLIIADNGSIDNSDAIAAGGRKSFLIDIEKVGYTPVGILGVFGSGTGGLSVGDFYLSPNNKATVYLNNNTAAAITPTRVEVRILYTKTRS